MYFTNEFISCFNMFRFRVFILVLLGYLFSFENGIVKAQENALLWEITGTNLSSPSYIFGTMHVKDKRAFQFHDSLLIKLKSCKVFAGEIVIDKKAAKEMSADILSPQGKELKKILSNSDYKKVRKYCRKNLGAMSLLVNKIKPIFTSALISESLLGNEMPMALDEYLQDKAKDYKLRIEGLETVGEQMSVLEELSIEDQALMLVEQINNIHNEKKEIQRLADLYASQYLDSILVMIEVPEMQGDFGDALIKNRNNTMVFRLEKYIQMEATFCAIGAAHLPGEFGMLNLLRNKGYNLRAIK
jgi:uncharacterized protein YbaP (TraB family)